MKTEVIGRYFRRLRFNKAHHLGLGDIRLTMGQQEMIITYLKSRCIECGKPLTDDEKKIGTCEDCLCPE